MQLPWMSGVFASGKWEEAIEDPNNELQVRCTLLISGFSTLMDLLQSLMRVLDFAHETPSTNSPGARSVLEKYFHHESIRTINNPEAAQRFFIYCTVDLGFWLKSQPSSRPSAIRSLEERIVIGKIFPVSFISPFSTPITFCIFQKLVDWRKLVREVLSTFTAPMSPEHTRDGMVDTYSIICQTSRSVTKSLFSSHIRKASFYIQWLMKVCLLAFRL
jgi:hypothetical protein